MLSFLAAVALIVAVSINHRYPNHRRLILSRLLVMYTTVKDQARVTGPVDKLCISLPLVLLTKLWFATILQISKRLVRLLI